MPIILSPDSTILYCTDCGEGWPAVPPTPRRDWRGTYAVDNLRFQTEEQAQAYQIELLAADHGECCFDNEGDNTMMTMPVTLTCDMEKDCTGTVTYIDNKGYTYCTVHGAIRMFGRPCRKMTKREIQQLENGGTIKY